MLPFFSEVYGNASSTIHAPGRRAADAVREARERLASLVNAGTGELVFTGGATESNNLAITGVALATSGERRRIVTTAVEHKAVLGPCQSLKQHGFEVVVLPVDRTGMVDLEAAAAAIDERTLLVSVQAANNEIGTIQPVTKMAQLAHNKGALLHCDGAQAVGKIPVDVEEWDVDFMSISAHKLYGPKGVGALYLRGGPYSRLLKPLMIGGGQEWQLRAGTLNVPGIVGFGAACELCQQYLPEESDRTSALRDRLEGALLDRVPGMKRNGALENRLPGNSSFTFPRIDADALIANTPDLVISTGSACTSGAPEPSHVLLAVGLTREEAASTIRIGVGRFNKEVEVTKAADAIAGALDRLSAIIP